MLVAGGATLIIKDRHGNTPRDLALQAEDRDLAAYLCSKCFHFFLWVPCYRKKYFANLSCEYDDVIKHRMVTKLGLVERNKNLR